MIIDTHCHIQFKGLDADRDAIINRCREKHLVLNLVGTQKDTSKRAVELAMQHSNMYASIGNHPNHIFPTYMTEEESSFMTREEDFDTDYYQELYDMAPEKIIGVGETGIDFFHIPKEEDVPFKEVVQKQTEVFLKHHAFAKKHSLPLVIHVRDPKDKTKHESAHEKMIFILKNLNEDINATIHCFSGNWKEAQQYLELGCHLGFTGVITFPPKKTDPQPQLDLLEVLENMPLDRMIVETDAPYLAPQAYRGKRSEPWMCEEQVGFIAKLRKIDQIELQNMILDNTIRLFNKIKI